MKDPAFLFYPGDWLSGTQYFTFEQKGAYLELLILQFNNYHFTEAQAKQVLSICNANVWDMIKSKFQTEQNNTFFFNERLRIEIEKRKKFTESRRLNALNTKKPDKKASAKHMDKHMENENRNKNRNKKEIVNKIIFPFDSKNFIDTWDLWIKFRNENHWTKYKEIGAQAALKKLAEISNGDEETAIKIINQSIENSWKGLFELKNNKKINGEFAGTRKLLAEREAIIARRAAENQ